MQRIEDAAELCSQTALIFRRHVLVQPCVFCDLVRALVLAERLKSFGVKRGPLARMRGVASEKVDQLLSGKHAGAQCRFALSLYSAFIGPIGMRLDPDRHALKIVDAGLAQAQPFISLHRHRIAQGLRRIPSGGPLLCLGL